MTEVRAGNDLVSLLGMKLTGAEGTPPLASAKRPSAKSVKSEPHSAKTTPENGTAPKKKRGGGKVTKDKTPAAEDGKRQQVEAAKAPCTAKEDKKRAKRARSDSGDHEHRVVTSEKAKRGAQAQPESTEATTAEKDAIGRIFATAKRIGEGISKEDAAVEEVKKDVLASGKTPEEAQAAVAAAARKGNLDRRAARMAFQRSMVPATKRATRAEKIPTEISLKLKANPHLEQHYFDLWCNCHESWGLVELIEKVSEIEKHASKQVKRWMNVAQMLDHFKIESAVASMVASKLKAPEQWRPSPDCPENLEAREFEVTVLDEQTSEMVWIKEKITKLKAELGKQEAQAILGNRIRKPTWAASGSCSTAPAPPAGKTAEELAAEAAEAQKKEDARLKKFADAKKQREDYKNSSKGKAEKWCAACTKDLTTLNKISEEIRLTSPEVGANTRADYESTIQQHIDELTAHPLP